MRFSKTFRQLANLILLIACCPISSAVSATYTYDDRNRLIEVLLDNGTLIIYTYDENGNQTGVVNYNTSNTYPISVWAGPGGTISPSSANVSPGGSQTFTIAANPGHQIEDVVVDGDSLGNPTPPSTYTFSNVRAPHSIEALFKSNSYTITAVVDAGIGSINPSSATMEYGESKTFYFNPGTGYDVPVVYDNGTRVDLLLPVDCTDPYWHCPGGWRYNIPNAAGSHSLHASFPRRTFTITTSVMGGSGTISPSAAVGYGDTRTFTFSPAAGFHITKVVVDGVTVTPAASYTFVNVVARHTLTVSFDEATNVVKNVGSSTLYSTLQEAYNAASEGDTLLCRNLVLAEDFNADKPIAVIIDGGYLSNFVSSSSQKTVLAGTSVISSGRVTWKNFEISR